MHAAHQVLVHIHFTIYIYRILNYEFGNDLFFLYLGELVLL